MTLEERKDNTYYDNTGKQILVGDLLKVYHFKTRSKIHYMYHVVVMEETKDFPVMAMRDYCANKPHYRALAVANDQRVLLDSQIVAMKDWETERSKIKVVKPISE